MEALITIVRFEIWFFIGSLALLVGYQMLTGKINMSGLLDDKITRGPHFRSSFA